MTDLDYIIISKFVEQINSIKGMFNLSTGQAIQAYIFFLSSIVIYAINITKRRGKK